MQQNWNYEYLNKLPGNKNGNTEIRYWRILKLSSSNAEIF